MPENRPSSNDRPASLILAGAVFSSLIVMGFFYMIYGLHADITQYSDMMRPVATYFSPRHIPLSCIGTCVVCSYNPKRYLSIGKMPKGT